MLHSYLMKKRKHSKLIKWFGIVSISLLTVLLTSTVLTNERILESVRTQIYDVK